MFNVEPAGHRILVKVEEVEEQTAAGIYIPKNIKDDESLAQEIGTVIAIGPTAFEGGLGGVEAWDINIGDRVLFMRYGGRIVSFPGYDKETHGLMRIVNDEDIIAKVRAE